MGKLKPLILLGLGVFFALIVSIFSHNWLKEQSRKVRVVKIKAATPPMVRPKVIPSTAATGGISSRIDPEKRAIAMRIDEISGIAGFIRSGDRVDVLLTAQKTEMDDKTPGGLKPIRTSKIVLENILVLATGKEVKSRGDKRKTQAGNIITLEVTPEECEKLALTIREGDVRLILRNPDSSASAGNDKGAVLKDLLEPHIEKQAVELITGGKMNKLEFSFPAEGDKSKNESQ